MSKALATTDAESRLYEFNARNQITLWGPDGGFIFLDIFCFPNLNFIFLDIMSFCKANLLGQILDYAGKQWSGMVSDYYILRCKKPLIWASHTQSFASSDGRCFSRHWKNVFSLEKSSTLTTSRWFLRLRFVTKLKCYEGKYMHPD